MYSTKRFLQQFWSAPKSYKLAGKRTSAFVNLMLISNLGINTVTSSKPLRACNDAVRVWVYGNFELNDPDRPENWPE